MSIFDRELTEIYSARVAGRSPRLASPTLAYSDFAVQERSSLESETYARKLAFWREQLDGVRPVALTTAKRRSRARPAASSSFVISAEVAEGLRAACASEDVTLFVGLLAAVKISLARCSGEDDIALATFVANREVAETRSVIGRFSNTVVLRSRLGGVGTFRDMLRRERAVVHDAIANQDVPFHHVAATVRAAATPFFNVLFSLNGLASPLRLHGLELEIEWSAPRHTAFDLSLQLTPMRDRTVHATWEFDAELFKRREVSRLGDDLLLVLSHVATSPDRPLAELAATSFFVERQAPATQPVREWEPPRTPTELALATEWSQLLGVDRVSVRDDFFELGGHSITVMRLIAAVRARFDIELSVHAIFEARTLEQLAGLITATGPGPTKLPPLGALPRAERQPLSFAQERLWVLHQLDPDSHAYILGYTLQFADIDVVALARAFEALAARHEILRTSYPSVDGTPYQRLHPPRPFTIDVQDARALSGDAQRAFIAAREHLVRGPFDLAAAPPLRVELVRASDASYVLLFAMHHIMSDGGSDAVFWRDLWAHYDAFIAGLVPNLPPLLVQYADFAAWQRAWLRGAELDRQLSFWTRQLAGGPEQLALPAKGSRPTVQTFVGDRVTTTLSAALSVDLRARGQQYGATVFMTFAAALRATLARYAGQDDVVIGAPIDNRNNAELDALIGMFPNTIALRSAIRADDTFASLLAREKATALDAYDHQHTPFERVVDALHLERSLARTPVFQVMYQHVDRAASDTRGAYVDTGRAPTADFDLDVVSSLRDGRLEVEMVFNKDLFESWFVSQLVRHLERLLAFVVKNPERPLAELDLLGADDHARLNAWNATAQDYPRTATLHELVEAQVDRTPDAIAVELAGDTMTYRELDERANQLAHHLRALGIGLEMRVGLCVERNLDMYVALLGILKAGAAYVPVEPTTPPARMAAIFADAGAVAVVAHDELAERVSPTLPVVAFDSVAIADYPRSRPAVDVGAAHLAYVIFTSGSTGRPKGVEIEHGMVVNEVWGLSAIQKIVPGDRVLQFATLAFDASVEQIFTTLLRGATLVARGPEIPTPDELYGPDFAGVTVMNMATAYWHALATRTAPPTTLRLVVIAGERALPDHVQRWASLAPRCALLNIYGPTEAAIGATAWLLRSDHLAPGREVPIGSPLPNYQVHVLDPQLRPVPIGVPGELYIGGVGIARGYTNQPGLTAERFVPDPFGTGRLYRTGDRVRWLPFGAIEYLGRMDHQIKLRGFRIEPGEIESVLASHPAVREAAVLLHEDASGDRRLVAYVGRAANVDATELRTHAAEALPDYMVPSAIVILDALPLTPNGKLDRKALPTADIATRTSYVAPRTKAESTVARVWAELLGVERVGVHDDFFALGGHSLLAIRLIVRLEVELGVKVSLRDVFAASKLRDLAARVGRSRATLEHTILSASEARRAPLPPALRGVFKLNKLMSSDLFARHVWSAWIDGALDLTSLERAVAVMRERHAVLRTRFFAEDTREMLEVLDPSDVERFVLVDRVDLGALPVADQERADAEFHRSASFRPLDLGHGEVMSVAVSRWSERRYRLTVSLHNIVSDAESMTMYIDELCALWRAFAADPDRDPAAILSPVPLQYHHLADYLERLRNSGVGHMQRAFWTARLDGMQPLDLPIDSPRDEVDARREANAGVATFRSASVVRTLPAEILTAVERIAASQRATVMSTLVAAMAGYLGARTGQRDLAFITRLSHRYMPGLERTLGFMVNPILLRISTAGEPAFSELVARTHTVVTDAFDHGESDLFALAPYSAFRFCLVYTRAAPGDGALPQLPAGSTATRAPHPGASAESQIGYDLLLWLHHTDDGVVLTLAYNLQLFHGATAVAFLEGYVDHIATACD
jgi:amino acid adenylation domain-containing protein